MTNNLPLAKNRPIDVIENRLIGQLVHSYGRGKNIRDNELEDLALKIYLTNGRGITFSDIVKVFGCSKPKAQLRLKNACKEKIDKNGKKSSLLFTLDNERTHPQQYYPSCNKAKIIENKRNRLIDPTGANYYNNKLSSHYPLYNAIEQQMVSSFLTQLYLLSFQPLYMHNIHLWMHIDKSYYEELNQKPVPFSKTKIQRERIGLREVVYKFHKKSIEIEIGCSKNPFPIGTSTDVLNFYEFLGEVRCTLAIILNDPRQRIVPPIDNWIFKSCDFNKDIELNDKDNAQFMGLNLQIKSVGESFRLYVKNLEDRFVLREEKVTKVNQSITTFMNDSISSPFHLIDTKFNEFMKIVEKRFNEINNKIDKLENQRV